MTALWIILGFFAFLFLLLLCPITLTASYETQLEAKLRFLFFSYRLAPKKEKKPKKKGKAKKQEEGSPAVQESKLKQLIKERGFAGFLRLMKELAQLLTEAVKDFLRHANVKELELRLTAAGEDAADTAVKYGYACSVVYPVVSMITALSGCKNYKVSVIPGFREKESSVFCYIKIRFGPIFLVASGFKALHKYFKLVLNQKKVETLKMEQTIAD